MEDCEALPEVRGHDEGGGLAASNLPLDFQSAVDSVLLRNVPL